MIGDLKQYCLPNSSYNIKNFIKCLQPVEKMTTDIFRDSIDSRILTKIIDTIGDYHDNDDTQLVCNVGDTMFLQLLELLKDRIPMGLVA